MTIALPPLPRDASYSLRPVKGATSVLRPAFGGPRLPLARKGDHWAIDIEVGGLDLHCASSLVADLVRASGEVVSLPLPSSGHDVILTSDPVVAIGGQAGSLLLISGLLHGYPIRKGRMFSLLHAGRRYVHIIVETLIADVAGQALVPIWPMLRVSPAANDRVELIAPRIEGFVEDGGAFDTDLLPMATLKGFTIEERA